MTNPLNKYNREALTALYASFVFLEENDLRSEDVKHAILKIEAKTNDTDKIQAKTRAWLLSA